MQRWKCVNKHHANWGLERNDIFRQSHMHLPQSAYRLQQVIANIFLSKKWTNTPGSQLGRMWEHWEWSSCWTGSVYFLDSERRELPNNQDEFPTPNTRSLMIKMSWQNTERVTQHSELHHQLGFCCFPRLYKVFQLHNKAGAQSLHRTFRRPNQFAQR